MNISFTSGKCNILKPVLAVLISLAFSFQVYSGDSTATAAAPAAATAPASSDAGLADKGKTLFENNCASCHALDEVVVGPALRNVQARHSQDWLKKWIKNSSALIASGDKEAKAVYEQYSKQAMPSFAFSDEELSAVIEYVKTAPATTKVVDGPKGGDSSAPAKEDTSLIKALLVVFIGILALMLGVLVMVLSVLSKVLKEKTNLTEEEQYLVNQKFDYKAVLRSRAFMFIVGFLFVSFVGKAGLDGLMDLGMQQGYAPKQPIPFSHKLHAGKYKIDCNYCHTGVNKSKAANIPSANICMNCHNTIKTDSPNLKPLFDAVKNETPIEWVRVHNLPDLAYFNHSQHVKVGGIECQQCHGPVQEMEVVQQYSPLTMGWCINCHRETPVNAEGNKYYDKLVVLHKERSKEPMKVKDIGGLECSKCHY